jgi:thioredoxin 1
MGALQVNDSEFDSKVLKSSKPVLVDFWAEWCGPCKQVGPIIDEIASEMGEKLEVVKINIDQNPDTPQKYGVRGIPTLLIFNEGSVVATKVGSMPKTKIVEWISSTLG